MSNTQNRSAGILLHITSLPSPYGIGTFGAVAEKFVDFLAAAGQKYWQVLPLNPTGYGDSPYQPFSAFAGNPYLIDFAPLVAEKFLTRADVESEYADIGKGAVDYGKQYVNKFNLLRKAFDNFTKQPESIAYCEFCATHSVWLNPYAEFMASKKNDNGLELPAHFWCWVQFVFFAQWDKLKKYANSKGLKIIGDAPIYCAADSADLYNNPRLFLLDHNNKPTAVAGVPPDYFSETGQLWGNPLYDWVAHKSDGYQWWIARVKHLAEMYDLVRIDHFRAFDTFWKIPYGDKTAVNGKWELGPGIELFDALKSAFKGELPPIIAEDLGELFDSVKTLLAATGFPGMRVLEFGFNPNNDDNIHLPWQYGTNTVAYTGTHDNDTLKGWYTSLDKTTKKLVREFLGGTFDNDLFIRTLFASSANTAIVPLQDWLDLGTKARMNTPGTMGANWAWRMATVPDRALARRIKKLTETYNR
ncbi:MAG: 4-alpha-glucanotransferase [Oscillospiraceae bacterium]|jgi:4-alpha-glucanotransferase|nr:4-alpha-glucanotransferase [Oscillospiraceae bacterium]